MSFGPQQAWIGYREVQQREEGTKLWLGKRVRGSGHSQGTRSRVIQPHVSLQALLTTPGCNQTLREYTCSL